MILFTCGELGFIMRMLGFLMKLLKIAVPITLILLIVIDFAKAVIANDDKKMHEATSVAGKRLVYALVIFLVPTIVRLIFNQVGNIGTNGGMAANTELNGATSWIECYNSYN